MKFRGGTGHLTCEVLRICLSRIAEAEAGPSIRHRPHAWARRFSAPLLGRAMKTDEELFQAYARGGDRDALEELFERRRGEVYTAARRILRNDADAQDATQAAFLRAMRNLHTLKEGARFPAWLRRIGVNEALGMRRSRRVARSHAEALPRPEGSGRVGTDELEVLQRALDRLPEDYRVPILLHHAEGLTYEEIGRLLDWPRGTVGTNIHRGMGRLKASLSTSLAYSPEVLLARLGDAGGPPPPPRPGEPPLPPDSAYV